MRLLALKKFLMGHGIPVDQWGTGNAKTLEQLFQETEEGETALDTKDGILVRTVRILTAWVYHQVMPTGRLFLVEDRQELSDGRVRRRGDFGGSITEKMKKDEVADLLALGRAMKEELGFAGAKWVSYMGTILKVGDSFSYPGLPTMSVQTRFEVMILPDDFRPEGYVETQDDKRTIFLWRKREVGDSE